ncbi:serine/threonine-protein phosphatase 7 inactive homolog isoform X2 [Carica papaya]|uniref:serine/threonine-protein phosphatase 7 inactive homolog isoform X2 n=1 Tax=Carica papaya TaxID=3649 RepID=UPI000B8CAA01|nr:serine/threonine-protein phosphatase 7 inactive homolog isoform X2 [Carica papaya]
MLPLAAVIMNSICTTHGGLFCSAEFVPEEKNRQISLGSLEELDHLNRELVGEGEGLFWGPDSNETSLKKSDLKGVRDYRNEGAFAVLESPHSSNPEFKRSYS